MDRGNARTRVRPDCRWWTAASVLVLGGCLVDEDKLCNENQVKEDSEYVGCVCKEGTVPSADKLSCQPCGADEEIQNDVCVCRAGFRRPAPGMACAEIVDSGAPEGGTGMPTEPTGQGMACTSSADCADFDAKYCVPQQNVCLVQNCATGQNKCSTGRECCQFNIPPVNSANGLCLPVGMCPPMYGMVVTP